MPETKMTSVNLNPYPFRKAAVLGAGVMGAQIAAHLANAGLQVELLDLPAEGNKNALVEGAFLQAQKTRPNPFFIEKVTRRIQLGNFEDHLHRIADVDWVIEAVIEEVSVKQKLMAEVEAIVSDGTVISTNTSGIPIQLITEGRSIAFKQRFLGTHFFNPPRYLKLLEVIPGAETNPEVVARITRFGRERLGKGVVITQDTPGFIGNRIGVFEIMHSIHLLTNGTYTIEEIDALTGPLIGRPTSATFRTSDVVGLDTLVRVADFLYQTVEDESREIFQTPELVRKLVATGATGAKRSKGFYQKVGDEILSVNPKTLEYEPAKRIDLGDLSSIARLATVQDRVRTLYADGGRAGAFFRDHMLAMFFYCAHRIPEITDNPTDIDCAMRWGFGWEIGPFEMWDAIGFEQVVADMENMNLPDWVKKMADGGSKGFYGETEQTVYVPGQGQIDNAQPSDEIHLSPISSNIQRVLWQNKEAILLDIGDQVALYEFRSKANTLSTAVVAGLIETIDLVEQQDYRGMVIANEGKHFTVGANLKEMMELDGQYDQIDALVSQFQKMIQKIHYAAKPVVVATHGRVLGGGCEMAMACTHPVADAESYIGLVELAVGLIPAGCGTMRLAAYAHEKAPTEHESHIQPHINAFLKTVGTAQVSESAHQAQTMGFLPNHTRIVMHPARKIYVAKEEVIRLSNEGYWPPPVRNAIKVLGAPGRAEFEITAHNMLRGRFISDYDCYLAERLAYVMTGGNLTGSALVHENYLLELEREIFLSLLGEEKTKARIESILMHNKPLRN